MQGSGDPDEMADGGVDAGDVGVVEFGDVVASVDQHGHGAAERVEVDDIGVHTSLKAGPVAAAGHVPPLWSACL